MKGLLLAGGSFFIFLALSLVLLRFYHGNRYFKVFLAAALVAVLCYSSIYWIFPANLGFLPAGWREPYGLVDFLNGLVVLIFLLHGFWDAAYTTALTGFSANLIVILNQTGVLSHDQLLRIYGVGDPLDQVLARRLPMLLKQGYLEIDGSDFRLRMKGWIVGSTARLLKRILTASEGGG